MKNRKTCRFIAMTLALAAAFVFATPAGAALYKKTIEVFTGIDIYVDGIEVIPTDANGSQVEVFAYNGTTYVPLRAVSQALGKPVEWDGVNQRVYIGKVPGQDLHLNDVCPPYQTNNYDSSQDYATIAGVKYLDNALFYSGGYALYNLNGQFSTLEFDVGHLDGEAMYNCTINIYLDSKLAYTKDLSAEDLPTHVTVALNGALHMKIEFNYGAIYVRYAIVNATIE